MRTWEREQKSFEAGPWQAFGRVALWLGALLVLGAGTCVAGHALGFFTDAAKVAHHEFGPEALLHKYEWFKDAAAQLDKKQADIRVYAMRLKSQATAMGAEQAKWPRDAREQQAVWQSEVAGVIASYNALAADYNAQMAKFNWRFTNAGDVPAGGAPLPREFRTYKEEF